MKKIMLSTGLIILSLSSCSKNQYKLAFNENQCGNNKFASTINVVEQKQILSDYLKNNDLKVAPEDIAVLFRSSLRNENDCEGKTGRQFLIELKTEKEYNKAIQLGFYLDKYR